MFSELRSSETLPANQCGTNERGLPRQAGDTWMVDCNRSILKILASCWSILFPTPKY